MEKHKTKDDLLLLMDIVKKITPRNPKEAAKNFILPYIIAEIYCHLVMAPKFSSETSDYAARLQNKKIVITKFYDVPVMEIFDYEEILCEFVQDLIQLYSKP